MNLLWAASVGFPCADAEWQEELLEPLRPELRVDGLLSSLLITPTKLFLAGCDCPSLPGTVRKVVLLQSLQSPDGSVVPQLFTLWLRALGDLASRGISPRFLDS